MKPRPDRSDPVGVVTLVAHRVARVGGMERAFAELAEGLLARGLEVHVICHHCGLRPHPSLHVHRVRGPNRPFLLAYPLFLVRGTLATWRHRRGLVHVLGAIVMNRADVATVQFCHHGFDAKAARGRARKASLVYSVNARAAQVISVAMERWAYRPGRVRWLVPASEGVAAELRAHFPTMANRLAVIPNGVDRRHFSPAKRRRAEAGSLVAVFVGGDWERKGLRYAVEALAAAPGWRLVVVGDGPRRRYADMARALGVEERVRFIGHRPDPAECFAAADAFVLPTAYEAFPLVMLEAAASGVPVLATRVNGASSFIDEGVNGFFIEQSRESVSARLNLLSGIGAERRREIGQAARTATTMFSWDRIVDDHIELYAGLAREPGAFEGSYAYAGCQGPAAQ